MQGRGLTTMTAAPVTDSEAESVSSGRSADLVPQVPAANEASAIYPSLFLKAGLKNVSSLELVSFLFPDVL